jgi:putative transposase
MPAVWDGLMELDVEGRCGAGHDEKTTERLNSRNG